ncbi:TPA: hypothetical protein ACH3X1_011047 [Trebouxia sp. C0004]
MPIGIPAPRPIGFRAAPCNWLLLLLLLVGWTSSPAAAQATQSPACPKAACYNATAWLDSSDQPLNLLVIFKVYKAEGPQPKLSSAQAGPNLQNTVRLLLTSDAPVAPKGSSKAPPKHHAEEDDGSASGPTTDPVLIQLQQSFIPAASSMQSSGISHAFFAAPQNILTTITAGYEPHSPSTQDSVQAANGPTPTSESSSDQTLFMADGLKLQQLHTGQWGLDRIDQQYRPLNRTFMFGNSSTVGSGQGVTIYTMDSGIRQTHQEFQPWQGNAQRVSLGPSFASDSLNATDCDGHGTHIGSTAVGRTVGVAKEASLVAVRVLDCTGAGQVSDVVKGLEWVGLNHKLPAVVTMSLGVKAGQWSQTLQSAVTNLIEGHGITVVVATGNDQVDACQITPANVNGTIAVAGSDMSNKFNSPQSTDYELIYEYDNTGACVDIFAPGVDILAACGGAGRCTPLDDSNYAWASGTSMAVPHVAGAAAIYLAQNPNATPAQVSQAITTASTPGLLDTNGMLPGTPNRLLYVDPNVI